MKLVIVFQFQSCSWLEKISSILPDETKVSLVTVDELYESYLKKNCPFDAIIAFRDVSTPSSSGQRSITKVYQRLKDNILKYSVKRLMRDFSINDPNDVRIVTADEMALYSCAKIRESLQIPGDLPKIIEPFINKDLMKEKLVGRVRCPRYIIIDFSKKRQTIKKYVESVEKEIGAYPCVAKPINLAGSTGVEVLHSNDQLVEWFNTQITGGSNQVYEIDEFIEGDLYHCDFLAVNNEIVFLDVALYSIPNHLFLKGENLGSIKLPNESAEYSLMKMAVEKLIKQFIHIPNGFFHFEGFIKDHEVIFLEVAARPAGGMIPLMYEKMYNFNINLLHCMANLSNKIACFSAERNGYAAWMYAPLLPGKVKSRNEPNMSCESETVWLRKKGDVNTTASQNLHAYSVYSLLWGQDYSSVQENFYKLCDHQFFDMQPINTTIIKIRASFWEKQKLRLKTYLLYSLSKQDWLLQFFLKRILIYKKFI